MPMLDDALSEEFKARLFIYGPPKMKKTWWMARAAEVGLNVTILDCDGEGYQIARLVKPEARKRIAVINLKSRFNQPVMAGFVRALLKGSVFLWDEQDQKFVPNPSMMNPTHSHVLVNVKNLNLRDLLVIDSWTGTVTSIALQCAVDGGLDLSSGTELAQARETGAMRDMYFQTGAVADWMIDQFTALPCHLGIIGHVQTYEKQKTVVEGGRKKQITEWTRTQPISTSGTHAAKLSGKFSDFFFFKQVGIDIRISTESKADRDGGSRIIPPGDYVWGDKTQMHQSLNFVDYWKIAGQKSIENNPEYSSQAFKFYRAGEGPEITQPKTASATAATKPNLIGNANVAPASPLKIATGAISKTSPFAKKS